MDIRQIQYLAALAREKHFSRAAQQPQAFRARVRQLEKKGKIVTSRKVDHEASDR